MHWYLMKIQGEQICTPAHPHLLHKLDKELAGVFLLSSLVENLCYNLQGKTAAHNLGKTQHVSVQE